MAQTELQKAYAKQVKRIRQFIRRAEKRGYQFAQNVIPKKPKTIRPESVEKLRKITPEKLYRKSVYGGEATYGEIVKGTKGREAERKARSLKSAQTRRERKQQIQAPMPTAGYYVPDNISEDTRFFDKAVIGEYRRNISHFGSGAYNTLTTWLDELISEYGEHDVAEMLEEGARNNTVVTYQIAYDDEKLQEYMTDMFDFLEFGADYRAGVSDAFDEDSNFNSY